MRTPRNATAWISVEKNDKVDQVLQPKFKNMLKPGFWEYNNNKHIFYVKISSHNWTEIVIKSEEAGVDSYEGAKVNWLGFDEQPQMEIFDRALLRTTKKHGESIRVFIAATMWEEGITWIYDRFITPVLENKLEAKDIELVGMNLPMESNPLLDPKDIAEKRRQTALRSPEEAAVRFDGKYIAVSGLTPFNLEALMLARETGCKEPFEEVELYWGN
jgi:phage terminase large subunit-like protein